MITNESGMRLMKNYERDEMGRETNLSDQNRNMKIPTKCVSEPCLDNLKGRYPIKEDRSTNSAFVHFIEDEETGTLLCLKRCKPIRDGVYSTQERAERVQCVIDGLGVNKLFAPGVVLGIARIDERVQDEYIMIEQCSSDLTLKEALLTDQEHALIMKRLPDQCRLDTLLKDGRLDSQEAMDVLARQVADMHKLLEPSLLKEMGKIESLTIKLRGNIDLLERINGIQDKRERINSLKSTLEEVLRVKKEIFEERWQEVRIRRCHGDLKPGNLWLCPEQPIQSAKLLALDCIDFNRPDFYYIDTLCDVAMLAITLEHSFALRLGEKRGRELSEAFLEKYLEEAGEDKESVTFLLDYYMAEKAIVCAYTSHHYDCLSPDVVRLYLELAFIHAEKLNPYSQIGSAQAR